MILQDDVNQNLSGLPLNAQSAIKRSAIPRAAYDYQDLVGIEVLIRQYRDPELYTWVMLEADDTAYRALDDIVAARKDGSFEFVQVKFTVDSERYYLDWNWLLAKTEYGTSMLAKWATSLARIAAMGQIYSAGLRTNRLPSAEFGKCLKSTRLDLDLVPDDVRTLVEAECGGEVEAKAFFAVFEFFGGIPDLQGLEDTLRDQLVPTDTDELGWLAFRHNVRRWATFKNQPLPDGRILREHVVQLITKRRPKPIRQDFVVPDGYIPPSEAFDQSFRERIESDANPITILWGTPGRGKSTYLSFLTQELQKEGAAIIRHHYFLSAEDSSSNRTSFIEISASLIEQLYVRHPDAMMGVGQDADKLRSVIALAATSLINIGLRLYIVIDGLDHVWRDTHRVDQLNHLFNEILPLPPNISLILGTQRVPDEQLPGKLLALARDDDWVDIPRMDEVAVHRWVVQQDQARPLILRHGPSTERRLDMIDEVAKAFFQISQGHPLHLIYAYESLIREGGPTSADEVKQLSPCPDGDIRAYYKGLWVRLGAEAKNALHMLAGSDFFWPSLGIRQVLGGFSEIDYLLEPRNVGMVPFHSSIFAWVRERPDHAECYLALLPKIINWLANDAPEYWRWGWLWLVRAQSGDYQNLLTGVTRDWVVESLVQGWPTQQIENILNAAEKKTFEVGDYPSTVTLRSLKTRVSNAPEFQSRDYAAYRATALAISHNRQQTLNLIDDIHGLEDNDVLELARLGPEEMRNQTNPACLNELSRRVNAWISLRHRPAGEFTKLSDQLFSLSAIMDLETVRRTLDYARGFGNPEPHVSKFIRLLSDAQNIECLQFLRSKLRGAKWKAQRRMIEEALVRAGSLKGADVHNLVQLGKAEISIFTACWFLWRDRNVRHAVYVDPIPSDLLRERYSLTENDDVTTYFCNSFWIALRIGLVSGYAQRDITHPSPEGGAPGWLPVGLSILRKVASDIAEGRISPTFSAIYAAANNVDPVAWGPSPEREHAQYRAFSEALRLIAVDLHILGLSDPAKTRIPETELAVARSSAHWADQIWVTRNVVHRIRLLDNEGAAALLGDLSNNLMAKVTEFSERGESWAQLADLARLYGIDRQHEFLRHAAECLVGYGYRKDLGAIEVLDAVVELAKKNSIQTRARLDEMVPIIDAITEFTDGDETVHVRSELISVVAEILPERLPSLYEHHLEADEYRYADECLVEFAKIVNLESPEGAALARTFLDERTLMVLEDRSANEPAAHALLDTQNEFLGRTTKPRVQHKGSEEELSDREKEAAKIDPASFGSDDFAGLVEASGPVHYQSRQQFLSRWLHYWSDVGRGTQALRSILTYFEKNEATYDAEEILDEAFLVSLAIEGKDAAYPWLVRAHIHRHGWQTNWTSEKQVMTRIGLAAQYYSDRWDQYIKDTSVPAPYYRRRGSGFVLGYKYLVRFLILVGQVELADRITTSFVETLVEEVREQPIPEASWFY